MSKQLTGESLAHLRHELRTPVNHIVGYSELLIEDAAERHLESFVPAFQRIHEQGCHLLDAIQSGLTEKSGPVHDTRLQEFKANLQVAATEVLETSTSVVDDIESSRQQTLADLQAISWAVENLLEFAGQRKEVVVPKAAPAVTHAEFQAREFGSGHAKRYRGRILVADDDAGNRDMLRRRLECEGHEVVEVTNGLEALESLKKSPCDLVLLDIMMPVMDGFQALDRIKQDSHLRELPVIMISALDELQSVVRCIEMGAEDYLPKPFNRVLLRARIGASLEKKWLRDQERKKKNELEQTLRLLERAREELDVLASQDPLTGLANRRSVSLHLENRAKRGFPFGVVYIDLNGFKKVNDTLGHQAGDELLKQVADRLRGAFRSSDLLGRWGGDEFVAVVDKGFMDLSSNTQRIADTLDAECRIPVGGKEHAVKVGAAIGTATWRPGDPVEDVVQRADTAMYMEKLDMKEQARKQRP